MGLFDFLSKQVACPACGSRGALQGLFGSIRCASFSCPHYDVARETELRRQGNLPTGASTGGPQDSAQPTGQGYRNPRTGEAVQGKRPRRDDFHPGAHAIEVRYVNYRGEHKTYTGDRRTIRVVRKHLSLALAPTGQRITFAVDRLQNRDEIIGLATDVPTPGEQRVLRYHHLRGTTSELYEQLRRRFPDWTADR